MAEATRSPESLNTRALPPPSGPPMKAQSGAHAAAQQCVRANTEASVLGCFGSPPYVTFLVEEIGIAQE